MEADDLEDRLSAYLDLTVGPSETAHVRDLLAPSVVRDRCCLWNRRT